MPKQTKVKEFAKSLLVVLRNNDNKIHLKDLPNLLGKDKAHYLRLVDRIISENILPIVKEKDENYRGRGRKPIIIRLLSDEFILLNDKQNEVELPVVPHGPELTSENQSTPPSIRTTENYIMDELREVKNLTKQVVRLVRSQPKSEFPLHSLPSDIAIEPSAVNNSSLIITEDDLEKLPTGPSGLPFATKIYGMSMEESLVTLSDMNSELHQKLAQRNLMDFACELDAPDEVIQIAKQLIEQGIRGGFLVKFSRKLSRKRKVDELAAGALCLAGIKTGETTHTDVERVSQLNEDVLQECVDELKTIIDGDEELVKVLGHAAVSN